MTTPTTPTVELPGTQQARPTFDLDYFEGRPELYLMERKLDGFRLLVRYDRSDPEDLLRGYSRAHRDQGIEGMVPHVHRDTLELIGRQLAGGYTVLDGELYVAKVGRGHSANYGRVGSVMKSLPGRARWLQGVDDRGDPDEVHLLDGVDRRLHYVVFDVLYWDGQDVRGKTWRSRRDLLSAVVPRREDPDQCVYLSEAVAPSMGAVHGWIQEGYEGAVVKRVDRPYVSYGRPPDNWFKFKAEHDADVVCMGFTDGREGLGVRNMTDTVGAIVYGQYLDGELTYRGKCSGMDDAERWGILARGAGVDNRERYLGRVFKVKHFGIQNPGFRHPNFLYWRDDKRPEDCTWD